MFGFQSVQLIPSCGIKLPLKSTRLWWQLFAWRLWRTLFNSLSGAMCRSLPTYLDKVISVKTASYCISMNIFFHCRLFKVNSILIYSNSANISSQSVLARLLICAYFSFEDINIFVGTEMKANPYKQFTAKGKSLLTAHSYVSVSLLTHFWVVRRS